MSLPNETVLPGAEEVKEGYCASCGDHCTLFWDNSLGTEISSCCGWPSWEYDDGPE